MTDQPPPPHAPLSSAEIAAKQQTIVDGAGPADDTALAPLVDFSDPAVVETVLEGAVIEAREAGDDLTLVAPNEERFFMVRASSNASGRIIHRVDNNHVSLTFNSWEMPEGHDPETDGGWGSTEKRREIRFISDHELDLLLDIGCSHCKVCANRVARVAKLDALTPLISQFEELAASVAAYGVEVRLMSYQTDSGSPKKPRELWSSMEKVRDAC